MFYSVANILAKIPRKSSDGKGNEPEEVEDIEVYTESYGENQICKNVLLADRT